MLTAERMAQINAMVDLWIEKHNSGDFDKEYNDSMFADLEIASTHHADNFSKMAAEIGVDAIELKLFLVQFDKELEDEDIEENVELKMEDEDKKS